jgi:hypothetical protein
MACKREAGILCSTRVGLTFTTSRSAARRRRSDDDLDNPTARLGERQERGLVRYLDRGRSRGPTAHVPVHPRRSGARRGLTPGDTVIAAFSGARMTKNRLGGFAHCRLSTPSPGRCPRSDRLRGRLIPCAQSTVSFTKGHPRQIARSTGATKRRLPSKRTPPWSGLGLQAEDARGSRQERLMPWNCVTVS